MKVGDIAFIAKLACAAAQRATWCGGAAFVVDLAVQVNVMPAQHQLAFFQAAHAGWVKPGCAGVFANGCFACIGHTSTAGVLFKQGKPGCLGGTRNRQACDGRANRFDLKRGLFHVVLVGPFVRMDVYEGYCR